MAKESEKARRRHKALPVGLVVSGKNLLIIGGGIDTVSRSRHATMFDWRAVRILLPEANAEVVEFAKSDSRIEIILRPAGEDDVRWADVVVKDSGNFGDAREISGWCDKYRKLLNCVDRPEHCDLFYMSLLFRGPLVVGISSGGDAPALSAAMRRHLEETLGAGWAAAAEMMAEVRNSLPPGRERMELLRRLGKNSELLECVLANNVLGLRRVIDNELSSLRT